VLKKLKSKINSMFHDEFAKQRLSENVQIILVGTFWIFLFVLFAMFSAKHPSRAGDPWTRSHGMAAKFY